MLCLRCCRALPSAVRATATAARPQIARLPSPSASPATTRTFSSLLFFQQQQQQPYQPSSRTTSLLRTSPSFPSTSSTTTSSSLIPTQTPAQQQQARSFSASASLAGKRNTYNPSRRVQKRRHGFLARLRSRGGRKILMRRRAKGRKWLSW